jgi:hypothetical protein
MACFWKAGKRWKYNPRAAAQCGTSPAFGGAKRPVILPPWRIRGIWVQGAEGGSLSSLSSRNMHVDNLGIALKIPLVNRHPYAK